MERGTLPRIDPAGRVRRVAYTALHRLLFTPILQNAEFTLYHGTSVPPAAMGDYINPLKTGYNDVMHGYLPAVSTSSDLKFPIVHSLLNERNESLAEFKDEEEHPITLSYRKGKGVGYLITSIQAIDALARAKDEVEGYVYGVTDIPKSAKPYMNRADVGEWRSSVWLPWSHVAKVTMKDLPDTLLVVDGSPRARQAFLDPNHSTFSNPDAACAAYGLSLQRYAEVRRNYEFNDGYLSF